MLIFWNCAGSAGGQTGPLETIRDDVRSERSGGSIFERSDEESCGRHDSRGSYYCEDPDPNGEIDSLGGTLFLYAVAAPFYVPRAMLGDSNDINGFFPRFPYDHTSGYMVLEEEPGYMLAEKWKRRPRRWSGRMRFDYSDNFDDLERIGYHLLLTNSWRFGIETEMDYLQEQLRQDDHDHLWLGDCNMIYRFAQSEYMQWRAGLGFNWIDDDIRTDFGFNFTYGIDFFPKKPWVFSTTMDLGTIGSADLFRIRTTGGVIVHGIEAFVGYEYLDIDRTQLGGLIAGLRLWF